MEILNPRVFDQKVASLDSLSSMLSINALPLRYTMHAPSESRDSTEVWDSYQSRVLSVGDCQDSESGLAKRKFPYH